MLIVEAQNVEREGEVPGDHRSGAASYEVWVGINRHTLWQGRVGPHLRAKGAAALLRRIADSMEEKRP